MGIIPGGDAAPGRSGSKTIRRELLDEAVLSVQAGESISIENLSYRVYILFSVPFGSESVGSERCTH